MPGKKISYNLLKKYKMKPFKFHKFILKNALFLFGLSALTLTNHLSAQPNKENVEAVITNKEFPFITYLRDNPAVLGIINSDVNLKKQGQQQKARIEIALEQCKDVTCYASVVQWNNEEIVSIGDDLIRLCQKSNEFQKMVSSLKNSGYYNLSASKPDTGFVRAAWNNVALGVNKVLDVYIKSKRPAYAQYRLYFIPKK